MKKLTLIFSLFFVMALPNLLSAQTILTQTTLGAAVSSTSTTAVRVASATGVTATSTVLFVDSEAMFVNSANGTSLTVTRGYNGTQTGTHSSGALVWVAPPNAYAYQPPTGSCTRANQQFLPVIAFGVVGARPTISDCNGEWVTSEVMVNDNKFTAIYEPQPGAVIYTGIDTNGETLSATTMYCTEIDLEHSKWATGLGFLLGTTGGTSHHTGILYDATGHFLAKSASTVAGTASTYEKLNFTTKYYMVGPAKYYGCLQTDGTTATMRMLLTSVQDSYTTKGVTGVTYGTVPATLTVPTTFTTAVGPYEEVY